MTIKESMAEVDQEDLARRFLGDMQLFLGPDPEIMSDHDIAPRTDREEEILSRITDHSLLSLVRAQLQAGANESFEMLEQMGAAPGAKW